MVANFVDRVHGYPAQGSFGAARIVVHDAAVPVVDTESVEDVGEQLRRHGELAGDVGGFLLCVAVVLDSFVAPHRCTRRPERTAGSKYPFALHEQYVAQVAAVLERGPHRRFRSGA